MSIQVKGTVIQILKTETGVSKVGKEWKKQEPNMMTGMIPQVTHT